MFSTAGTRTGSSGSNGRNVAGHDFPIADLDFDGIRPDAGDLEKREDRGSGGLESARILVGGFDEEGVLQREVVVVEDLSAAVPRRFEGRPGDRVARQKGDVGRLHVLSYREKGNFCGIGTRRRGRGRACPTATAR